MNSLDLARYPFIRGKCDVRFGAVADKLNTLFSDKLSNGCAVAAYRRGAPVFSLWGGTTDRDYALPWQENTLVNVFSAGKPFVAVAILQLAAQGLLDLDAPIADYWPEFAAHGKGDVSARHALCHRSGIPAFTDPIPDDDLYDWHKMVAHVAAIRPEWPAGERQGYHAFTYGWILGELVRRISGEMPGDYIRQHICAPLKLDFHIGLCDADLDRVAVVQPKDPAANNVRANTTDPDARPTLQQRVFNNPTTQQTGSNRRVWRQAQIPAANGHGTAASLAAFYNALCGYADTEILNAAGRALCRREISRSAADEVNIVPLAFSHGFFLSNPADSVGFGRGRDCFGHPGAGGSTGFADPDYELSFAFVTRDLGAGLFGAGKAAKLADAMYQSLI